MAIRIPRYGGHVPMSPEGPAVPGSVREAGFMSGAIRMIKTLSSGRGGLFLLLLYLSSLTVWAFDRQLSLAIDQVLIRLEAT